MFTENDNTCEFCKEKPGIHAIPVKGGFIAACHKCYLEHTQPVTRAEIKDIIKEAIKEYENRDD